MNWTEFSKEVARTTTDYTRNYTHPQIRHAIWGICSEAGELADAMKKAECGKPSKLGHLDEEVADLLWYIGLYCNARGTTPESLLDIVAAKLRVRHTSGWDPRAMEEGGRNRAAERRAMEYAGGASPRPQGERVMTTEPGPPSTPSTPLPCLSCRGVDTKPVQGGAVGPDARFCRTCLKTTWPARDGAQPVDAENPPAPEEPSTLGLYYQPLSSGQRLPERAKLFLAKRCGRPFSSGGAILDTQGHDEEWLRGAIDTLDVVVGKTRADDMALIRSLTALLDALTTHRVLRLELR